MVSGRTKQTILLFPGISLFTHHSLEQASRDCSRNNSWYGHCLNLRAKLQASVSPWPHLQSWASGTSVLANGLFHCGSNSLASLFLNKLLFGQKTSDYNRIPQVCMVSTEVKLLVYSFLRIKLLKHENTCKLLYPVSSWLYLYFSWRCNCSSCWQLKYERQLAPKLPELLT